MPTPTITPLNYTFKKDTADLWALNLQDIPVNTSKIADKQIVSIGPNSFGGNHKHPRTEWFIALDPLQLIWLDEDNNQHTEEMFAENQLFLITIPPYLPHVVLNTSATHRATLFEYADAEQHDVERVELIK